MTKDKISLYFFGTDAFAATILKRLLSDHSFDVRGVVVPPDAPVGRRQVLIPCPVKELSVERGLSVVYDPMELLNEQIDFFVVASYGRILSQSILDIPRISSVNVHASLLPQYRGASPIQTALLNGDRVTGICLIKMVKRMDAGPIYSLAEVAIRPDHDAENLRAEMAHCGAEMVAQTLPGILEGDIEPQEQDETRATYCPKIERTSGEIHWDVDDAITIERKRRAYTPWPGIYTNFDGKRLKIHRAHAVDVSCTQPGRVQRLPDGSIGVETIAGALILEEVQLEGKSALLIPDFIRGNASFPGSILGV